MKLGDQAKQVVHPIQGLIVKKQFNEDTDSFQYLLEYENKEGELTQSWFNEGELEATEGGK